MKCGEPVRHLRQEGWKKWKNREGRKGITHTNKQEEGPRRFSTSKGLYVSRQHNTYASPSSKTSVKVDGANVPGHRARSIVSTAFISSPSLFGRRTNRLLAPRSMILTSPVRGSCMILEGFKSPCVTWLKWSHCKTQYTTYRQHGLLSTG